MSDADMFHRAQVLGAALLGVQTDSVAVLVQLGSGDLVSPYEPWIACIVRTELVRDEPAQWSETAIHMEATSSTRDGAAGGLVLLLERAVEARQRALSEALR